MKHVCYTLVNVGTSTDEEPSEPKRVGRGDVVTSKAMIGSQAFCRRARATRGGNPATATLNEGKGIFAVDKL